MLTFDVERLESRRLLAGNVVVDVDSDQLTIRGDNADNSIYISRSGNDFLIRGQAGTRLKYEGQEYDELALPLGNLLDSNSELEIKLRGGDDHVLMHEFDEATIGEVTLDVGSGDDVIEFVPNDFEFGSLTIKSGSGSNNTVIQNVVINDELILDLRGEYSSVLIEDSVMNGDFFLSGRGGIETIAVTQSEVDGDFIASTRGGGDRINIGGGSTFGGDVEINLGSAGATDPDRLQITAVGNSTTLLEGDLSIRGGGRAQLVDVSSNHNGTLSIMGTVDVATGSGNDHVFVQAFTANSSIEIIGGTALDMGGGDDTIYYGGLFGQVAVSSAFDIETDGGDDLVRFDGIEFPDDVSVESGSGDDLVALIFAETDSLIVDLGGGADFLILQEHYFQGDAIMDGGGGFDQKTVQYDQVPGSLVEFEDFET